MSSSDLLEEYKTIIEQNTSLSDRRQSTNDIYVALNSAILTALGFLLVSSHLRTWWPTGILVVLTIASWLINRNWALLLNNYRQLIQLRIEYLKEMEKQFPAKAGGKQPGIFLEEMQLYNNPRQRFGFSRLERQLVTFFLVLYPLITIVIALMTYLISANIIQPLTFN